jgi:hypothetical protein
MVFMMSPKKLKVNKSAWVGLKNPATYGTTRVNGGDLAELVSANPHADQEQQSGNGHCYERPVKLPVQQAHHQSHARQAQKEQDRHQYRKPHQDVSGAASQERRQKHRHEMGCRFGQQAGQ